MKPPSEVTVLSDNEPVPSLLPLLLEALDIASSSPFLSAVEGMSSEGREVGEGREGVVGKGSRFSGFDIEPFRLTDPCWDAAEGPPTTTLETETEVVAGVTVGRLMLEARFGALIAPCSRSTLFRVGDDFDEFTPSSRLSGVSRAR